MVVHVRRREASRSHRPSMAARRAMDLNNDKLSGVAGGVKKVVRKQYSPGTQMLSQIKKLQNSTGNVMSVAPFTRIVREFGQDIEPLLRIEPAALEGLQKTFEGYVRSDEGLSLFLAEDLSYLDLSAPGPSNKKVHDVQLKEDTQLYPIYFLSCTT